MTIVAKGFFRGKPFFTQSSDTQIGRRQPTYSVPFSEKGVLHVDLGKAARKYKIEAIVIGSDYASQRDALIEALEKPGPGLLIHPVFGRVLVVVGTAGVGIAIGHEHDRSREPANGH